MEPIAEVRRMLSALIGGPDTPFMERRPQAEQFAAAFVTPEGITIDADTLGGVVVERISTQDTQARRVFFHLHGGGFVLGNPAGSRAFTCAFARLAACKVVSVDYRLAPEHPFPAAVDDAVTAYRALLNSGVPAKDIAVGGESAGGGLAVSTLIAARDRGLPMPAALICISPWVDLRCGARSFVTKADVDPLLTRRSLKEMALAYLDGRNAREPLASPLLADLSGLPPMLVHAGSDEVLLDDAVALVEAAKAAGVAAQLEIWPGMIHVWHMFHAMLPEAIAAIEALSRFVVARWREADA